MRIGCGSHFGQHSKTDHTPPPAPGPQGMGTEPDRNPLLSTVMLAFGKNAPGCRSFSPYGSARSRSSHKASTARSSRTSRLLPCVQGFFLNKNKNGAFCTEPENFAAEKLPRLCRVFSGGADWGSTFF
jgi:hypothetical protein